MKNLVFDGDSLTLGIGAYPGFDYPSQCVPYVLPQAWHTFGVDGQNLLNMEADAATQIDPLIVPGAVNIVVLWGGTNDFWGQGVIAATVIQRMKLYCDHRRAAGWKVIVLDVMPRADFDAAREAQRVAFNAALTANWATFADAFVSVASDSHLQAFTNSTYFTPGGIHLTEAGYGIVARLVAAQILALDPPMPLGGLSVFCKPGDTIDFLFSFRGLDTLGKIGLTPSVAVNAGTLNLVANGVAEQIDAVHQAGLYRYQFTVPANTYGPLDAQATVTNSDVIDRMANSLYFSMPWLAFLDAPISGAGGGGGIPPQVITNIADIKAKTDQMTFEGENIKAVAEVSFSAEDSANIGAIKAQTDKLTFVGESVKATGQIMFQMNLI